MMKIMKTMQNISKEDIALAEKMWDARQRGLYYASQTVTDLYNKLLQPAKPLGNSNCGSCIRHRIDAIHTQILKYKTLTELEEENAKSAKKDECSNQ